MKILEIHEHFGEFSGFISLSELLLKVWYSITH